MTAISFAPPIATLADTQRRKNEAIRYLGNRFDSMTREFPDLEFGLKSSDEPQQARSLSTLEDL